MRKSTRAYPDKLEFAIDLPRRLLHRRAACRPVSRAGPLATPTRFWYFELHFTRSVAIRSVDFGLLRNFSSHTGKVSSLSSPPFPRTAPVRR